MQTIILTVRTDYPHRLEDRAPIYDADGFIIGTIIGQHNTDSEIGDRD